MVVAIATGCRTNPAKFRILRNKKGIKQCLIPFIVVEPGGIEPPTFALRKHLAATVIQGLRGHKARI